MILQALLVSKDDLTAETLIQVLAQFGVAVDRSSAVDVAVTRLAEERFDQVIVDFDDPERPLWCSKVAAVSLGPDRNPPVTVALLHDAWQIRSILGAGAHFILIKPIAREQAKTPSRCHGGAEARKAAIVAGRSPAAVSLRIDESNTVEGILLDLSTGGMDVLAPTTSIQSDGWRLL